MTDFHRNTNSDKRSTRVTHHAKAPSAGSTQATGNSRGLFRRAFATRGVSRGSKESGAPSSRRLRATLAVLALAIAAFALTAAPASAATAEMGTISAPSYTSAHVTGKVSTATVLGKAYSFEYSTDGLNWASGFSAFFFGAATNKEVEGTLSVPHGGTKYFVRLTIQDATDPASPPYPSFTTLPVDPPTIPGAVEASPIFSTSATATAKVQRPANADPAFDVNCHFEYITDAQYEDNVTNIGPGAGFTGATPAPCAENPIDKADLDAEPETKVTAPLTGLSPATAYHLRLIAENAAPGVVTKEAAGTFTTEPPVAKPVVIKANDATDPSYFSAKASGEIQRPEGADPALNTSCRFEYVTDEQFNDNPSGEEFLGAGQAQCQQTELGPITTTDPTEVTAELTGLKSGTTFHLRLTAANEGGTTSKDAASTFTTLTATPPAVAIDPPSGLGYTKVHLWGTVDPEGGTVDPSTSEPFPIFWQLQFSRADEPGNWQLAESGTIAGAEAATTDPITVAKDLEGLKPGTEYDFRLLASYADREAISAEGSFTTEAVAKPIIALDPVTDFTATTAKFTGTVSANAPGPLSPEGEALYKTEWSISCDPACPKLSNGGAGTVEAADGTKALSLEATDLEPNAAYEVTLEAANAAGGQSVVQTFKTTLIPPGVKATAGAPDGKAGYNLQGVVNPHNSPVSDCHFVYGPNSEVDPAKYAFSIPCSPTPKGKDEIQTVAAIGQLAGEGNIFPPVVGQFRLSFRGQTTPDLPFDATPAEVDAALEALTTVGANNVAVNGQSASSYEVEFIGALAEKRLPLITGENGTIPLHCDPELGEGCEGKVSTRTVVGGGDNFPVTVEGHVTGLTPDATYHSRLVVTNGVGTVVTPDQTFVPTLATKGPPCPNEQLRAESNSLALPECRAYEMVTPPGKEGFSASLRQFDGGDHVAYLSGAGNIAKSGQNLPANNKYVAARTAAGWETLPDLNGSSGSFRGAPSFVAATGAVQIAYSSDLLSSLWRLPRKGDPPGFNFYLRNPDGTFTFIAPPHGAAGSGVAGSADLSHFVLWTESAGGALVWGPGVYDFVGTGVAQPRRVDIDNLGSPISTCTYAIQGGGGFNASGQFISNDGRVIVVSVAGGCGGANPPAEEIWARVNGTTSFDITASQCKRTAPADPCNAPSTPTFQAATPDGSRVFFTTTQQLVDGDTDQTNDLYACDIPPGTPAPTDKANHCSALRQISAGAPTGADVESVGTTSEDGSTVLFTAKGVLAGNEDALKEKAVDGDHNLYVWRTDAAHPDGQTRFVARLDSDDLSGFGDGAQTTPDGRYLVFTTASQLVDTDTDNARDVYRYETETGQLTRASTNIFGVAGNGVGFDAGSSFRGLDVSDDGQKIVFTTTEPLSPADGNDDPDVYLWTPARVSLITTGSSGYAVKFNDGSVRIPSVAITGSGQDIFFESAQPLTPTDGDDLEDIYDARIGGGFSFAQAAPCSGEACQPGASGPPAAKPLGSEVASSGNPTPVKPCPKGKVRNKKGKCVKKNKKHSGKKHHGKKASHKQGGGK